MKRKLLLAAVLVASALGFNANAQTDVTSTYLTNADFSSGTPIDNNIRGYGKDMTTGEYYGLQDVTGWSKVVLNADNSNATYLNSGMGAGVFAYGSSYELKGNNKTAPETNPNLEATGNCLGFMAVWSCGGYYYQDVTLPAGTYKMTVPTYNQSGTQANTSYIGFISNDGEKSVAATNPAVGEWTNLEIDFVLLKSTSGKIALGYLSTGAGAAANPHLYFDHVTLTYTSEITYPTDATLFITNPTIDGASGWTIERPNGGNGPLLSNTSFEYWGGNATGGYANGQFDYYQTITGLPKGKYTVSAEMYNTQTQAGSFVASAGVYATNSKNVTEYKLVDNDVQTLVRYTTDEIVVMDGELRIGVKNQSAMTAQWFVADNFILTLASAPDLSDYVEAYNEALAAAKAVDQTQTMAPSVKTALQNAISTYDEGEVDETSASDLEAAIDALLAAKNKATTSIASYAIIASGVVRTDVLDGWSCTNTNTFHINTWSTEGNSDGSGMTTPFIENWRSKADNAGLGAGTFSYTIEGLEPGEVYYAQALIRSYNERNSDAPNGPNFFVNDAETDLSTVGTTFTFNSMSGIYATIGAAATVTAEGTLTLGARIAGDANYNWVAFKDVSIQPMSVALAAAVSNAEGLYTQIPSNAKTVLKFVVDANKDDSGFTTATEYEDAINAINAAYTTASGFVTPYASWAVVKDAGQTFFAGNTDILANIDEFDDEIETATSPTVITQHIADVQNAQTAYTEYIEAAPVATAMGVAVTAVTDFTTIAELISGNQNLNVAQYAATNSYTYDATSLLGTWTGAPGTNSGESWNGTTGTGADAYYDLYNAEARAMTQTVTLPKAKYVLFAKGRASAAGLLTLTDGTTTVTFPHKSSTGLGITTVGEACFTSHAADDTKNYANSQNGRGWEYRFLAFESDGTTPVTLTFNMTTASYNWVGLDDIVLLAIPEDVAISEDADYTSISTLANVTLTRTLSAANWNTFVVPFAISNAELEDQFGAGVEVAEYSESAEGDESTVNFTKKATASVEANVPVLIKTPKVSGTSFAFEAKTIETGDAKVAGADNFDFVGSYAASITLNDGDYFISADNLYKKAAGSGAVTLKGTRAYIKAKSAGAKILRFSIDDEGATGIDGVSGENGISGEAIYNVAGQQVDEDYKGIVIKGGKKYLQK